MALDEQAVTVAGTGHLWVAPTGTTLPAKNTDPTAHPGGAFVDLGYIAQDGVTATGSPDITEFFAWQNVSAIRRSRKSQTLEMTCDMLQWEEGPLIAAFGGGSVDTSGSYPTYTFPRAGDALQEYAVCLDIQDGDRNFRFVVPRMNSGLEDVAVAMNADNLAVLPLTLRSLASDEDIYIISDDVAAFVASS